MISIKKKHNTFDDISLIKNFSSVVRFSFNRRNENPDLKPSDVENIVKKTMNNLLIDSSFIKTAVKKSFELDITEKLYFGGKSNCFKSKYHKSNTFKDNRLIPIDMRGSTSDPNGNRKAKLDIINNIVIFKPKKGTEYKIPLNLSKNERKMLIKLQEQCENKQNYFNIKIDLNNIWISFDESKLYEKTERKIINERYLGIDLNPNYIAFSIIDFKSIDKIIYKEIIDISNLNKENSDKKNYELIQINKRIINLFKEYNCNKLCIEDLNIRSKDNGKGKNYNRLVNNNWNRNYLVNNLKKRLNLEGLEFWLVRPEYSSFIGQMKYSNEYDSIAASIEIGYRGYLLDINLNEYTSIDEKCNSLIPTQWKKMVLDDGITFRNLYKKFKEKKLINSYRFVFDNTEKLRWSSFRLKSDKSKIDLYRF